MPKFLHGTFRANCSINDANNLYSLIRANRRIEEIDLSAHCDMLSHISLFYNWRGEWIPEISPRGF